MKMEVNRNASSQYYFPKALAKVAGENAEVIPNAYCLVMFPKGSSPGKVLRSLEIIQKDLEHQIEEEKIEKAEKEAGLGNSEEEVKKPVLPKSDFDKMRAGLREVTE